MRPRLGTPDEDLFAAPRADLLQAVTGLTPADAANHVPLDVTFGVSCVQRLAIASTGAEAIVGLWPCEMLRHARPLYESRRGTRLVAAAIAAGWDVRSNLHLGFRNAPPSRRLYLNPLVSPEEYARRWEVEDYEMIRQFDLASITDELWPWLIERGYVTSRDGVKLEQFLDVLGNRPAHLRPGLRIVQQFPVNDLTRTAADIRERVNAMLKAIAEPTIPVR